METGPRKKQTMMLPNPNQVIFVPISIVINSIKSQIETKETQSCMYIGNVYSGDEVGLCVITPHNKLEEKKKLKEKKYDKIAFYC